MRLPKHSQTSGFTLIELMIVVAIIGVLSAVSVGQYEKMVIKAKISEGIALADRCMLAMDVEAQTSGKIDYNAINYGALPACTSSSGSYTQSAAIGVVYYGTVVTLKITLSSTGLGKYNSAVFGFYKDFANIGNRWQCSTGAWIYGTTTLNPILPKGLSCV